MVEVTNVEMRRELGVTAKTLREWRRAGCPFEKRDGRVYFDRDAVLEWMERVGRGGGVGVRPYATGEDRGAGVSGVKGAGGDDGDAGVAGLGQLTRKVNLRIKELEVEKRERLEAEARGELVELDAFRSFWSSRCVSLHDALRALPDRVAKVSGDRYEEVHAEAELAIQDALRPFAVSDLEETSFTS